MPAATVEPPSVALSFANNFWGKEDAGVPPLLDRMHSAKQTSDELRAFYAARASIEDDYARKLLSLCRKPLGSQEAGTLKGSLDTVRGEVEAMARQHQGVAAQMKTELEEPLAAFAGSMKERRKIVQNGIEKLLKIKVQQTQQVNKTRDKYEQECLKIKGYLAQGHMVMGQEERKNKAKLEKTQISLATSNTDYENAIKALEETTARWNREWKAAADKFQDLEEERLDFTKSSLWAFANIASTVCVSDDSSCEKIRLSLEKMDVEKDIYSFISERGTGQEIPDPPKYINFCRGDVNDTPSEVSEDESYSVAQFPRSINPAFRTSSPQPSLFESHHDPKTSLVYDMGLGNPNSAASTSHEVAVSPQKAVTPQRASVSGEREPERQLQREPERQLEMQPERQVERSVERQLERPGERQMERQVDRHMERLPHRQRQEAFQSPTQTRPHGLDVSQYGPVSAVPHDPYPMDGMTMLCRPGPTSSEISSVPSQRPSSRDSRSDYSNPTSFTSQDPQVARCLQLSKIRCRLYQHDSIGRAHDKALEPEPIEANASLALGVGPNVLPVAAPSSTSLTTTHNNASNSNVAEDDPIAIALAELKGVTKQSSVRVSADYYHGISTPAPGVRPGLGNTAVAVAMRGTPPPSYDQQVQRLGVPSAAHTARAMKETSEKFVNQTRNVFGSSTGSNGYGAPSTSRAAGRGNDHTRATSPAPPRSASPLPNSQEGYNKNYRPVSPNPSRAGSHDSYSRNYRPVSPNPNRSSTQDSYQRSYRSVSPNPNGGAQRAPSQMSMSQRGGDQGYYRHNSPMDAARTASPAPYANYDRPSSSHTMNDMAVQLAPVNDDGYGSQRGRYGARPGTSSSSRAVGLYEGPGAAQAGSRQRSKSVADPSRQYTRDGRPVLHFARALYMYQAAIPEELGFAKGDVLAVLRHQDDGWWEAEVHNGNGRVGLVPSNYLQPC
ncbi:unnamed protein product [Parascedosporium putredinis]|uniref:Cell division control protein n=1 Tax=Parascedosporium putredinis TaxID=1442378 RepID=A0A9P1H4Z1_9PEZI|nr:unnamed protein product [Parascedosporium putredinis]CAI7996023.1 unnamed protein product [Parascedosporium putredinis]